MESSLNVIAVCQVILAFAALVFITIGIVALIVIYKLKLMAEKTFAAIDTLTAKASDIADDAEIVIKQLKETTTNISGKVENIVSNVEIGTGKLSSLVGSVSDKVSGVLSPLILNTANAVGIGVKIFNIVRSLLGNGKK